MKRLRFPYVPFPAAHPLWPLFGRQTRPQPVFHVTVLGPTGSAIERGLLDAGSDDTVFPVRVARAIGLDLSQAPTGSGFGFGLTTGVLHYAEVKLRITDGREFCEWPARVAFTSTRLLRPLLGFAGLLQFFRACYDGELEEVELTTNGRYPGT